MGMAGVELEAMECAGCNEIQAVAVAPAADGSEERCSSCGSEEFRHLVWRGYGANQAVECRRCRSTATVSPAGIWD